MANVEYNLCNRDVGDNSVYAVRTQDGAATGPPTAIGKIVLQALAHHHHTHLSNLQQPQGSNAKLDLAGRLCRLLAPLKAPRYQRRRLRQQVLSVAQKPQAHLLQLLLPWMDLVEVLRVIPAPELLSETAVLVQDFVGKLVFSVEKDVKRNGVLLVRQLISARIPAGAVSYPGLLLTLVLEGNLILCVVQPVAIVELLRLIVELVVNGTTAGVFKIGIKAPSTNSDGD